MFTLVEELHYLGIALVIFSIALLAWIVLSNPLGKDKSISQHAASTKKQYVAMGIGITIIATLLFAFLLFWLAPSYGFSLVSNLLLILFYLGGLLVAWFPADTYGSRKPTHVMHVTGTYFLIVGMFTIAIETAINTSLATMPVVCIFSYLSLGLLIYLTFLYWLYPPARNKFMFYESLTISIFLLQIVLVSLKI